MLETNDLRKGARIELDRTPFVVVDAEHVKPGKGQSFARVRLRNLISGQVMDRTFKSGERFEVPDMAFRQMQYLFSEGETCTFMDSENYEQVVVNKSILKDQAAYLQENMNLTVWFFEEKPVNVEFPIFIEMPIEYCEPGFRGDTATGTNKPATLPGGLQVSVPLHLKVGDIVKIDTRTGEYVEKVNK